MELTLPGDNAHAIVPVRREQESVFDGVPDTEPLDHLRDGMYQEASLGLPSLETDDTDTNGACRHPWRDNTGTR